MHVDAPVQRQGCPESFACPAPGLRPTQTDGSCQLRRGRRGTNVGRISGTRRTSLRTDDGASAPHSRLRTKWKEIAAAHEYIEPRGREEQPGPAITMGSGAMLMGLRTQR